MPMSVSGPKKSRGRPLVESEAIKTRVAQPVLGALDSWIADQDSPMSRPEAIRLALRDWLTGLGYMAHRGDSEGAN